MAKVRQSATAPELATRKAAAALGLHYRLSNRDLPGSPDLANRRGRWAIFVHGCFWHRHKNCPKASLPKRNWEFWAAKFRDNYERDKRVTRELVGRGYKVVVIWECQTKDVSRVLTKLESLLGKS
ncbi:MAG: DNA mismatch endonuclease Vsr [Gammaproteobacteria bacterium]|nr:DNA mismatch endonuclease Vsr [Gammaproteobacteria bacterium]